MATAASTTKSKTPRKQKTAKEQLAEALMLVKRLEIKAAAEDIEEIVANTKIVEEYAKMRKGEDGKDRKDYVILEAIAKAVGAKGVEIKPTKTPQRKPRDPNAPKRTRKPKQPAAT